MAHQHVSCVQPGSSCMQCVRLHCCNTVMPANCNMFELLPTNVMLPCSAPNCMMVDVAPDEEEKCVTAIVQQLMAQYQDSDYFYCADCRKLKKDDCNKPPPIPVVMVPMYSSESDCCPRQVRCMLRQCLGPSSDTKPKKEEHSTSEAASQNKPATKIKMEALTPACM